ncbi:MFS transporter [Streptomyces sp. NPDC056601]|uniref:MFS transporter n=1 Tax=Streptomyces sp. NPDC056601 TaxID=3345875 RepID=UPI00368CBCFF
MTDHSEPAPSPGWRRPYLRYLTGRGVSTAGTSLVTIVQAFAVHDLGGDAFSVAMVLTAAVLTQILLLPVGGVLSDRLPRRTIVVSSNLLLAATQAGMGAAYLAVPEHTAVWMFVVSAAVTGACTAITQPAFQGVIVEIVPSQELQRANASLRLVLNIARIAVPGAGSSLGAAFGYGIVLLCAGAAFLTCSIILLGLNFTAKPVERSHFLNDIRDGWHDFTSRTWLWTYVVSGTIAVPLWLAGYQLLGPVVVSERNAGLQMWGWAVSAFSAGLVAGSLCALRWKPQRLMLSCVAIQLLYPIPLAALAVQASFVWIIPAMLISGISLELSIVFCETAKQRHVPERLIGRVTSLTLVGETALVPLAYLLAGYVADRIGSASVLWMCFAGIFASTSVLFLVPSIRGLTNAQERPSLRAEPAVTDTADAA